MGWIHSSPKYRVQHAFRAGLPQVSLIGRERPHQGATKLLRQWGYGECLSGVFLPSQPALLPNPSFRLSPGHFHQLPNWPCYVSLASIICSLQRSQSDLQKMEITSCYSPA